MVLTVSPTALSRKLQQCDQIAETRVWPASYDTAQYKVTEYARVRSRQPSWDEFLADGESIFKIHPRSVLGSGIARQWAVVRPLLQLVQQQGEPWQGTAAELLDELALRGRSPAW